MNEETCNRMDPTIHFNKFINRIKKRQLKKREHSSISNKKIKRDNDEYNSDNSANKQSLAPDVQVKPDTSEKIIPLGLYRFTETKKVEQVLPKWLLNPKPIYSNLTEEVVELPEIDDRILSNLAIININNFFPVQQSVIPWIIQQNNKSNTYACNYIPQDVCVSSPTGSGKTLAFVLPIVQDLLKRLVPCLRCLVVVPVQELAEQVANVFRASVKGTPLRVEAISGGKKSHLRVEQQILIKKVKGVEEVYESLVDILVVTPGRLVEHLLKTKGFNLKNLKYLVVDEADRMMDGLQNDWVFYLEKHLGHELLSHLSLNYLKKRKMKCQKLLFSATLSQDPEKLKKMNLFQPVLFTAVDSQMPSNSSVSNCLQESEKSEILGKCVMPVNLKELYIIVKEYEKPLVIAELLQYVKWRMILCFCKSAFEAYKLSKLISLLCPSLKVRHISSNFPGKTRKLLLNQFSNGEIDMLVSTDVTARGIDIPSVRFVISYDAPKYIRTYVHRAGRTGRAGMKGTALTFATPAQVTALHQKLKEKNMFNLTEFKLNQNSYKKWLKKYKTSLKLLRSELGETKENSHLKTN